MVVTLFSPAKINLFLAITGSRADGYHDLVSVAAPLDFGDELQAEVGGQRLGVRGQGSEVGGQNIGGGSEGAGNEGRFSLECDHPGVPVDGSNLILKAAQAFAAATGWTQRVHFKLTKRIPLGAGLGGGSSNAVAALRAMNQLAGGLLSETKLAELAVVLGSDCALFLANAPVIMRGRGERVEALPAAAARRLRGRLVLLLMPSFGISTAGAYGRMAAAAKDRAAVYLSAAEAEKRLGEWIGSDAAGDDLLYNNMEGVAFDKYIALPVLLAKLRARFGGPARMSGSGSACFALPDGDVTQMKHLIRECWGPTAFVREARLL